MQHRLLTPLVLCSMYSVFTSSPSAESGHGICIRSSSSEHSKHKPVGYKYKESRKLIFEAAGKFPLEFIFSISCAFKSKQSSKGGWENLPETLRRTSKQHQRNTASSSWEIHDKLSLGEPSPSKKKIRSNGTCFHLGHPWLMRSSMEIYLPFLAFFTQHQLQSINQSQQASSHSEVWSKQVTFCLLQTFVKVQNYRATRGEMNSSRPLATIWRMTYKPLSPQQGHSWKRVPLLFYKR